MASFKPVDESFVKSHAVSKKNKASVWDEMKLNQWEQIDFGALGFTTLAQAKRSLYNYGFKNGFGVRTQECDIPGTFFGYLIA